MEVVIRRAEPRDVPRMLELVRELALFEKEPQAVTVTEQEMHDAGFGPNAVWVGWVAEKREELSVVRAELPGKEPDNGQRITGHCILGIAICYTRYSTWRGRVLYLEDIVVTEAARGQGIGDRLIRTCIDYAAAHGYARMRWQVLDWNTDAMRFYERFDAIFDNGWVNVELDKATIQRIGGR